MPAIDSIGLKLNQMKSTLPCGSEDKFCQNFLTGSRSDICSVDTSLSHYEDNYRSTIPSVLNDAYQDFLNGSTSDIRSLPRKRNPSISTLYPVPRELSVLYDENYFISNLENRISAVTDFEGDLQEGNYTKRFHSLLHLEELVHIKALRLFNADNIILRVDGKHFIYNLNNEACQNINFLNIGSQVKVVYKNNAHTGYIIKLDEYSIILKFKNDFTSNYDSSKIKASFPLNRLSFVRQHLAIESVVSNLGFDVLLPHRIIEKPYQINASIEGTKAIKDDEEFVFFNTNLDIYQRRAVINIMQGVARPTPYIIFGPPGTGKSSTIIETILQVYKNIANSRILVTTPSNSGANLITQMLVKSYSFSKENLIRISSFYSLTKEKSPTQIEKYSALLLLQQSLNTSDLEDTFLGLLENIPERTVSIPEIKNYRVVVTTCNLLGSIQLRERLDLKYSHIFIDEAGQCTEPEALIPITFIDREEGQIILAGDPKQLGPVVMSYPAQTRKLGKSFIARLLEMAPYHFKDVLNEDAYDERLLTGLMNNYRSVSSILKMYSDLFYNSKLLPTICNENSSEIKLLRTLHEKELLPKRKNHLSLCGTFFYSIHGANKKTPYSHSWCNVEEAKEVYTYAKKLYKVGMNPEDIGIITPYKLQAQFIMQLFRIEGLVAPKIGSVEEFQGQERAIILISLVRSCSESTNQDTHHLLGFVQSPERCNVAISRARALCMVYGNANLLHRDQYWRKFIVNCYQNETYFGASFPKELTADQQ